MKKSRAFKAGALLVSLGFLSLVTLLTVKTSPDRVRNGKQTFLTKDKVAEAFKNPAVFFRYPKEIELPLAKDHVIHSRVEYAFHPKLQKAMEDLFQVYDPDYGAFVALDAKSGRILSMVSYSRDKKIQENLALRASFPSASIFKVVTAAAAIGGHKISPDTVIPYNGRNHTLYRGQILESKITRWTRFITLKEAFANSINTVFGKIGAYVVGSDSLRLYADRFGFNRKISADLPIQEGRAFIPDDLWGLAESASGFTRDTTMSPLQGALIASAVANDGVMMEPYMVQTLWGADGNLLYVAQPKVSSVTMDPSTASEIRRLMKETVLHGTSRGSFRGFFKKDFALLDVGGKTGSLRGHNPQGKYDWFVGYANAGSDRIAMAALTINGEKWRVRSSYLARRAIEKYFKENPTSKAVAKQ